MLEKRFQRLDCISHSGKKVLLPFWMRLGGAKAPTVPLFCVKGMERLGGFMESRAIPVPAGELAQFIKQNPLVLVDFQQEGCKPCGLILPDIQRLAEKYAGKVAVAMVDVGRDPDLAAQYGIRSLPTVLIFRDGAIIAQETGARLDGVYEEILDANL